MSNLREEQCIRQLSHVCGLGSGFATFLHRKANIKSNVRAENVISADVFRDLFKANQKSKPFCISWLWGRELNSKTHFYYKAMLFNYGVC